MRVCFLGADVFEVEGLRKSCPLIIDARSGAFGWPVARLRVRHQRWLV